MPRKTLWKSWLPSSRWHCHFFTDVHGDFSSSNIAVSVAMTFSPLDDERHCSLLSMGQGWPQFPASNHEIGNRREKTTRSARISF
jgi:hypothetical protein